MYMYIYIYIYIGTFMQLYINVFVTVMDIIITINVIVLVAIRLQHPRGLRPAPGPFRPPERGGGRLRRGMSQDLPLTRSFLSVRGLSCSRFAFCGARIGCG